MRTSSYVPTRLAFVSTWNFNLFFNVSLNRVDRPQLAARVRWSRGGIHPGGAVAAGAAGALEGEPCGIVRLRGRAAAGASHGPDGGHVPCVGGREEAGVSERRAQLASVFCCSALAAKTLALAGWVRAALSLPFIRTPSLDPSIPRGGMPICTFVS